MARRATSLGPKPSLFVFFVCFFFWFLSLFLIEKPCFPPKKAFFVFLFQCFPFFLPSLFWPPPFSLSLSQSLCFSSFFLSFFSFFFVFFLFLVFVFVFLSSLLLFHEKNNIKIFNYKGFVHQSFLIFVGFLSYFFFQFSLSLFFFSDVKFCFLFNFSVFL